MLPLENLLCDRAASYCQRLGFGAGPQMRQPREGLSLARNREPHGRGSQVGASPVDPVPQQRCPKVGRLGTNQAPGPSAGLPHGQAASSAGERVFRTADPLIRNAYSPPAPLRMRWSIRASSGSSGARDGRGRCTCRLRVAVQSSHARRNGSDSIGGGGFQSPSSLRPGDTPTPTSESDNCPRRWSKGVPEDSHRHPGTCSRRLAGGHRAADRGPLPSRRNPVGRHGGTPGISSSRACP
jgi:hypothetical protein